MLVGGLMQKMSAILVGSVVIGAYLVSTIFQIVITKKGVSEGKSFLRSGVYASLISFFISIAIIILFLFAMHFLMR